ncbi:MAG: prepilin peptidase [Frankia sp.]
MNAGLAALASVPVLALVPPLHRVVAATGRPGPGTATAQSPAGGSPAGGSPPAASPGPGTTPATGPGSVPATGPGTAPGAAAAGETPSVVGAGSERFSKVVPPPRPSLALQFGATAAVAAGVAVALRTHPAWLPAYFCLSAVGVALAITDLRVHRLPDALTLPSYPVLAALFAVAAAFDGGSARWVRAAIAGAVVWLVFAALWMLPGDGLGFGDVKISGLIGGALGWLSWGSVVVGIGIGMIGAGLVAAVLLLVGRAGRRTRIAYGPYLLVGTLAAVLLAHPT